MKAYIARHGRDKTPEFAPPGNIVFLAVDKSTGAPAGDATQAINEAFISGTQPGADPGAQPADGPAPAAAPPPATPPQNP
jgi:hypothetical protein